MLSGHIHTSSISIAIISILHSSIFRWLEGFIGMVILVSIPATAQETTNSRRYRDSLYHHISHEHHAQLACRLTYPQGSATIHTEPEENREELARLDSFIHWAVNHPELYVSCIRLTGYSSIEGNYNINEKLSRQRAESFYHYLRREYPQLSHFPNDVAWVAEDWKGLVDEIRESTISEREEILEIIRKVRQFDKREALISKLNGGVPYREITQKILPPLRRVEMEIEYSVTPYVNTNLEATIKEQVDIVYEAATRPHDPTASPQPDLSITQPSLHSVPPSKPRFALKTNVLLWAGVQYDLKYTTPVANAALEYYINPCFSIELGAMYSYWRYNSNQKFQGISGYRIEPRYRFALPLKDERMEIFMGTYFRFGDYDLRSIENAETTFDVSRLPFSTLNFGSTGKYLDCGLSAGLFVRLFGQFGLEVGTRAGYARTKSTHYSKEGENNWYEYQKKYHKVRITDLNVSLIFKLK